MKQINNVSKLMTEIIRIGKRDPILSRTACLVVHELLDVKLETFGTYKADADLKMDQSVSKYWSRFGHFAAKDVYSHCAGSTFNELESMFVFPGRRMVRPPIKSDGKEKGDCTKKYFTSRPNMTSFISLKCPCRHPKIIGFKIIKEGDSIAMAISTVLEFLNFPPVPSGMKMPVIYTTQLF